MLNDGNLTGQKLNAKLKLAGHILLRSGAIGLISGGVLGTLFGCTLLAFIWTGIVGAVLGLGLGLVNGLLLSVLTCLFFYPLRYVRLYRVMVKTISASIAGGGAAVFGPWYFSSQSMTPSSAVFIGFSSVLASVVAGWAGGLAGYNMSRWYEQKSAAEKRESAARQTVDSTITSNKRDRYLKTILFSEKFGWGSVALFSALCLFPGNWLLEFLICGKLDVASCLPSPRLYTSVIAGFKVALPLVLITLLIVVVLQSRYKRPIK